MSSTVLYHIQGIRQYKLKRFVLEKGNISSKSNIGTIPVCGSKNVVRKGAKARIFTGVPLKFARRNVCYTRFFEAYALTLLSHMTCKDAAALCRVSWDTMKEIDKRNLKKRFSNPSLKVVIQIAIDEIAVKKDTNM